MEYRRLGNSGLQLSELSFGSWITFGNQIEDKTSGRLLDMAYDAGINFFDNAEVYANGASEEVMGRLLAQRDWHWTRNSVSASHGTAPLSSWSADTPSCFLLALPPAGSNIESVSRELWSKRFSMSGKMVSSKRAVA